LQIGEALVVGGLVMLVLTPIVYRVRTTHMHTRATRALLWPTAWMVLPLAAVLVGAFLMFATANLLASRKKSRASRAVRTESRPPV
jgi:uncharacterized membrane protein